MKVKLEDTPDTSGIKHALSKVDFKDTFSTTNHVHSLDTIMTMIFGTMPRWVMYLMDLRNALVKRLGLETVNPRDFDEQTKIGDENAFFKIYSREKNEIVLGADDKHLNFRVSIYNSNAPKHNIKVTTLVEYNNLLGKVYMGVIKPFHVLVVKHMVKQAYHIEKNLI
ncbi:DUF2867 domain-containing protein [Hyunsoonleella ulvae]|uniref:DUF2867 domain-containing protein n=1 Tax=Hyunsoonleella ulvae TaxID=2799948 RepID=UPI00193A8767|nr:DUF2867 domain-containing protein [Hyunsoonleella ulvae]